MVLDLDLCQDYIILLAVLRRKFSLTTLLSHCLQPHLVSLGAWPSLEQRTRLAIQNT